MSAFATIEVTAVELIKEFLESIKDHLIADLDTVTTHGKVTASRNATGKTKASIQVVNVTKDSGQLVANANIAATFTGRKPGKMPPISALIDWCSARGLPRGVAWAVAKKIAESGTELYKAGAANDNALKRAIDADAIKKFTQEIQFAFVAAIKSDLKTIFNK